MKILKSKFFWICIVSILVLFICTGKVQASEVIGTVETGKGYSVEYILQNDNEYTYNVKFDKELNEYSRNLIGGNFVNSKTVEFNNRMKKSFNNYYKLNGSICTSISRGAGVKVTDVDGREIVVCYTPVLTFRKGEKAQLVDPFSNIEGNIESSDSSILKVNNNEAEAVGVGKAVLKGKCKWFNMTYDCQWLVEVVDSHQITVHDEHIQSAIKYKLEKNNVTIWDSGWNNETQSATLIMTDDELKMIDFLDLKRYHIENISGLEELKYLNGIDLSENNIKNIEVLGQLSNLKELYLKKCEITDISFLKNIPNLEVLDVYNNFITDISVLAQLQNLRVLDIRNNFYYVDNQITKKLEDVSAINKLSQLKQLAININHIDKIDSSKLQSLTRLEASYDITRSTDESTQTAMLEDIIQNKRIPEVVCQAYYRVKPNENQVELPNIFKQAADSTSSMYSPEGFITSQCRVEGDKIITNLGSEGYAYVTIKSGNAKGTEIAISKPSSRKTTFNDENLYNEVIKNIENTIDPVEYSINADKKELIISTGALKRIVQLNLSNKNIEDLKGLSMFAYLEFINLNNNRVSDFKELKDLPYLHTLFVNNNNLQNIDQVTRLTRLKVLHASNNNFTSLKGITNLRDLESLVLNNNSISDISELSSLKSLKILKLDNNNISDISEIKRMKFNILNMNENHISDISGLDYENGAFECNDINATLSNSREIELPKIFEEAKDSSSKIYSASGFECTGCELRNGKVTVNKGVEEATVMIKSGYAAGTTFYIKVEKDVIPPDANISYELNDEKTEMTVTIQANEEIRNILSWERKDRYTIYKKFSYNVVEQGIEIEDLDGNKTTKTISVSGVKNPKIPDLTVKYSAIKPTKNNVTVTLSSTENLKGGAFGWEQCEDGKSIKKTFSSNTNHTATTESILTQEMYDMGMQPINIYIEISNIDKEPPQCEVIYSTKAKTSGNVTVTIKAENDDIDYAESGHQQWNIDIDDDNKAIVYKVFSANTNKQVIVYDAAGNSSTIDISIDNIDKSIDDLTYEYSTIAPTNKDVKLNIEANENIYDRTKTTTVMGKELLKGNGVKLANTTMLDSGFVLLADNDSDLNEAETQGSNKIIKTYDQNIQEVREIKDLAGNTVFVPVEINNIDKQNPKVENMEFIENSDGTVTVKIMLKEKIIFQSGEFNWVLSEDETVLTKTFDSKDIYEFIPIKDYAGNSSYVLVDYNEKREFELEQKEIIPDEGKEYDYTTSNKSIPQAGKNAFIIVIIAILGTIVVITKKKLKKYKNIK